MVGRKNGEVQGSRIRLRSGRRWSRRQQLRQSCRPRPCPANSCSTTSKLFSQQACSKFREEKIINSNSLGLLECASFLFSSIFPLIPSLALSSPLSVLVLLLPCQCLCPWSPPFHWKWCHSLQCSFWLYGGCCEASSCQRLPPPCRSSLKINQEVILGGHGVEYSH